MKQVLLAKSRIAVMNRWYLLFDGDDDDKKVPNPLMSSQRHELRSDKKKV